MLMTPAYDPRQVCRRLLLLVENSWLSIPGREHLIKLHSLVTSKSQQIDPRSLQVDPTWLRILAEGAWLRIPGWGILASKLSAGTSGGQLAWGAIWAQKCWFSTINIDVWARDLVFRLDETRASVTKYWITKSESQYFSKRVRRCGHPLLEPRNNCE